MSESQKFDSWALVELMGHQRIAGRVTEHPIGGATMLRVDVPADEGNGQSAMTKFYSPSAVYCITPITEELARRAARNLQPEPINQWDLPRALPTDAEHDDQD